MWGGARARGARGGEAQSRTAANSGTFAESDTAAEDPANADITSVVVSNDNAANLTFRVNIGNQPQLTSFGVRILLDTDRLRPLGSRWLVSGPTPSCSFRRQTPAFSCGMGHRSTRRRCPRS